MLICPVKFIGIGKCLSRPFQPSVQCVGFPSPSYLYLYVPRVDISHIEKRSGCRFWRTIFDFGEAHPRLLSNVTHSVFVPQKTFTCYFALSSFLEFPSALSDVMHSALGL